MTTKKKPSKKKAKNKRPTKAMLKEIGEVLQKHNSSGVTILFADAIGNAADATDAAHGLAPTPESLNCTPPKSPKHICKKLANGTVVCGWVCR